MDVPDPPASEDLLGQLLVKEGLASAEQVRECLRLRGELASAGVAPLPGLGDLMVRKGYLTPGQRDRTIRLSERTPSRAADLSSWEHAAAPPEALKGERVGKYLKTDLLGAGGMGEVWKAWDTELRRWVALKFLKGRDPEELARFKREAQTAGKLAHQNIAAVYEAADDYIAMQFVEGRTLADFPRNDARALVEVMRQAALAVHFAHESGVIHRDLKPANIMVTGPERAPASTRRVTGRTSRPGLHAFVMDFGLAKSTSVDAALSVSGTILGTPQYMSPEQARGGRDLDRRTDVYSLGATLYELLAREPPFSAPEVYELLRKIVETEPRPVRRVRPGADADLETIAMKCLEKEPARRYATALEFAEDLECWLNDEPIRARPVTQARRATLWARRNKALSFTAGAGVLGILLTAAWALWLSPAIRTSARRARLDQLERAAAAGVAEETARLERADAETVLREAKADQVFARLRARIPAGDDDERAAIARGLASYRPGPLLSRASYERREWSQAYRFDSGGPYGVLAQIELARQFAADGRLQEAASFLRRVRSRHGSKKALPLLAGVLSEIGDFEGAAAAYAETDGDSPRAKLVDAVVDERQSLPVTGVVTRGLEAWHEPMVFLDLDRPTLVLPWRDGRPAFEIRDGRLASAPTPLAVLEPADIVIAAAVADIDGDARPEIVLALERPGTGGGYVILARDGDRWRVARKDLSNIAQPCGLAVGDLDGCGAPEAVVTFLWQSSEQWLVRLREGRTVKFQPPGVRPWASSPLIGDFDGDGRVELFLSRGLGIGAQVFRVGRDGRMELLDSQSVGNVGSAVFSAGFIATLMGYPEEEAARGRVEQAGDYLEVLRWVGGRVETVARHFIGPQQGQLTNVGGIAIGRLAGLPAIVGYTWRNWLEPKKRRPEGERLRILLGEPTSTPIVIGLPHGIGTFTLRDLDGDGESELIVASADRLIVRGRRKEAAAKPVDGAPEEPPVREVDALFRTVQDLFDFESYDSARDLLAEIIARFPSTHEAAQAERLRIDALFRSAQSELAAAERAMAERHPEESNRLYGNAIERFRAVAAEAREAADRLRTRPEIGRQILLQAAEALRLARDWDAFYNATAEALGSATEGDDAARLDALRSLVGMRDRIVFDGNPASERVPFVADFPARLRRTEAGLVVMLDSHSTRHVAGVPIEYIGGAFEFEMDLELEGSVWSAAAHLGLVPREARVDPSAGRAHPAFTPDPSGWAGSVPLWLHGTDRWDRQGAGFTTAHRTDGRVDRYRGRWRIAYGYVPEANMIWVEVRDLDHGERVAYRAFPPLDRRLSPGRYVFGVSIGYEGGDALVSHAYHPAVTSLRISRAVLRAAHADLVRFDRGGAFTLGDLRVEAGSRLSRGDRAGALELYRRILERDATDAVARVHLALAGGTVEEFARGFEIDSYGFVLVLDDAMRGAGAEEVRRMGTMLRAAAERHPGPCFALMGDFEKAAPHLKGNEPAMRYLRRRSLIGTRESLNEDWHWLVSRSMRTAGTELPFLIWAPGADETPEDLRREMTGAVKALGSDRSAADWRAWVAASRVLLLDPDDRDALKWHGWVSVRLDNRGYAERDWRHLTEVAPEDSGAWLLLARCFAWRRAVSETLESLEAAARTGLRDPKVWDFEEFRFLKDEPRFQKLRGR